MARPKEGYRCADGQSVPGLTTILNQNMGWNKGQLMGWAWKQGRDGKALRESQDEAMTIGTMAHQLIEWELQNKPQELGGLVITPEQKDRIENCLLAFYEWRAAFNPTVLKSEFPLVSETWRFGCTPDHLVTVAGKTCLLEVKTGTGDTAYADWWIQLAAQAKAVKDVMGTNIEGYHILKIDKESAGFSHFYRPELTKHWQAFLYLLELEKLRNEIGK